MDELRLKQIMDGMDRFREGGKYRLEPLIEIDESGKEALRGITRTNTLTGEKSHLDPGDAALLPSN